MTDIIDPNAKDEAWFRRYADQLDPSRGSDNLDLFNLISQHQEGGLPDKTAPDYVERNRSGELASSGLLVLINLLLFAPSGLRLMGRKDARSGIIVGWELVPWAGNEYTDTEIKAARTAAEARWPGIEVDLVKQRKPEINVIDAATVPEPEPVDPVVPRDVKTQIDPDTGLPIVSFVEKPDVDGVVLWCLDCKEVPIVGDLLDFEAVEGGFLCSDCHTKRKLEEADAIRAEHERRTRIANEGE